jgi:hypothetical protein
VRTGEILPHSRTLVAMGGWVDTQCAGCGRPVAADRDGVEAGARVLCTVCEPGYLPLTPPAAPPADSAATGPTRAGPP